MMKMRNFTLSDFARQDFYQVPKFLFAPPFDLLPVLAKLLYGLLLDRHKLSVTNGWVDEDESIYFYFARQEMMRMLDVSLPTVIKLVNALKDAGLIKEVRQGLNLPNRIYMATPVSVGEIAPGDKPALGPDPKNLYPNKTEYNKTENSYGLTPIRNNTSPLRGDGADEPNSVAKTAIGYFTQDAYPHYKGKKHPILKPTQLRTVIDTLDTFIYEQELEASDIELMADEYFETVKWANQAKTKRCDHNINHFAQPQTLQILYDRTRGGKRARRE